MDFGNLHEQVICNSENFELKIPANVGYFPFGVVLLTTPSEASVVFRKADEAFRSFPIYSDFNRLLTKFTEIPLDPCYIKGV